LTFIVRNHRTQLQQNAFLKVTTVGAYSYCWIIRNLLEN